MQEQGLPPEFTALHSRFSRGARGHGGALLLALPIAAGLGAALAFRPRRPALPSGRPPSSRRKSSAIVGGVVMLIVGSNFGFVPSGSSASASLIRYRAKIDDPKDAVVCWRRSSVGPPASGWQLYGLAVFSTPVYSRGVVSWRMLEPERRQDV